MVELTIVTNIICKRTRNTKEIKRITRTDTMISAFKLKIIFHRLEFQELKFAYIYCCVYTMDLMSIL